MTVNALAAAGDVAIAFSLCLLLQKSRTGFQQYADKIIGGSQHSVLKMEILGRKQ
jgi:hypothetical protein